VTRSPTRAAGLPWINTIPDPPSGIKVVIPGPCGAPSQASGGALGIVHVCWSVILQAGFPPINTFVAQAPRREDPCIVVSPSRAAGLPNGFSVLLYRHFNYSFDPEQSVSNNHNGIAGIHDLRAVNSREVVAGSRYWSFDSNRSSAVVAYAHSVALI
jgi:hypothetical protein